MLTRIKNDQTHFRGLGRSVLKQILLGQLVLFLIVGWGDPLRVSQGDRAFAQSTSDSVLDRVPKSVAYSCQRSGRQSVFGSDLVCRGDRLDYLSDGKRYGKR